MKTFFVVSILVAGALAAPTEDARDKRGLLLASPALIAAPAWGHSIVSTSSIAAPRLITAPATLAVAPRLITDPATLAVAPRIIAAPSTLAVAPRLLAAPAWGPSVISTSAIATPAAIAATPFAARTSIISSGIIAH